MMCLCEKSQLTCITLPLEKIKLMEQTFKREDVDASLTIILIALGIERDRVDKLDKKKKKSTIQKWTRSISTYLVSDMIEPYRFPYGDILNAKEIEIQVKDRVGVKVWETSTVPGPHKKPTVKTQRIETLEYLDEHPEASTTRQDSNEHSDLRDAIIAGTTKKAFLKPLEGHDKSATRLGHQNEPKYIQQYYHDSREGLVPGIKLIDVMACGLAMKKDKPYVRCSADAIAIEAIEWEDDGWGDDGADQLKSHPVECKCRSQSGYTGSLAISKKIAGTIANRQGPDEKGRHSMGKAVYCAVHSSDRELMAELIPQASERIQILHHAYTFGTTRTTFLVGDPRGKILYGLVVTFEESLLENYGNILDYLYENGLKTFYEDETKDLPLEYIETILLGDEKLKGKYNLDDFMFSLLIWRKINPIVSNPSAPKYPIPPCNMLVPLDYSLWNSSKGGSDTVTRLACNCKIIVPIKSPQSVVVARFLSLYAVLFHRLNQAVKSKKPIDIDEDTIKHIRNRLNRNWNFSDSLGEISRRLLAIFTTSSRQQGEDPRGNNMAEFQKFRAVRFTKDNKEKRFDVDESILNSVSTTNATPIGRGARKDPKNPGRGHEAYMKRCDECKVGTPMRLLKQIEDGTFVHDKHNCYLCNQRGISWMCRECKRILCFDVDRTAAIRDILRSDKGDKLRKMVPNFDSIRRGDAPAYYSQVGELKGKKAYTTVSCFQYCHPLYFNGNDKGGRGSDERDDTHDDHLSSLGSSHASSPQAK